MLDISSQTRMVPTTHMWNRKKDNGELCLQSAQCKSNCCHRDSGVSLARCAPKAAETQKCSPLHLYGVYYYCPCESGLTCEVDRSLVGSVTNTDFGFCKDPNE
ncbi:colipase isoform X2 [Engystomops pustulosus]|uniref:colipase isoform X2 n=1 Tax=Engystomops pustulosus TaxID=76066 RepID=UPI003AFB612A